MDTGKDDIFVEGGRPGGFQFNDRVAEVFDDMLERSVPCYRQVMDMSARILAKKLVPRDRVYDLGCSTGNTLLEMARKLERLDLDYTGIDSSPAMIAKAERKVSMYAKGEHIRFRTADILDVELSGAGAVILNYTLQFIKPPDRPRFLKKIHDGLRPGGVLLLSEKVVFTAKETNGDFIDFHHAFKREQGYSELEIAKKREALENVLIPFTAEENRVLLAAAGFRVVEGFCQWFNFVSFLAVK